MRPRTASLVAVALIVASCTTSNEPASTVTTLPLETTTTPPTTSVASTPETSSTTTTFAPAPIPVFPEYRITERIVVPETGDIVVVLLDPSSYTSLSDLDIYDVIADAAERFPPIFEAHVVDAPEAAAAVLVADPDAAQLQALATHYLARLEEGYRIVYVGPFADSGVAVLGS
jgi:hypothetical protein